MEEIKEDVNNKEEKNNLVDLQTSATQEINKGYMYANNKYETTYSSIINANIAYADAVERIVINDKNPQFIMDEDEMIQASNNIYYKSISLKKNIFDKLLGENGTIEDTKTVTIYWKWDYQTGDDANTIADNDEIDTTEGEQARSITFDVIVTGTQQENV